MRVRSNRRMQRDALESTWSVYAPREPGTPFTKADMAAAEDQTGESPERPAETLDMHPLTMVRLGLLGRLSQ